MYRLSFTLVLLTFVSGSYSQSCNLGFEGFENGGGFPPGYTVNGCYTNGTLAPFAGTYHAGFNSENDELISPVFNNPSSLCFYWRTSGLSSDFLIDIDWTDDGGTTWNTLNTLSVQDTANRTTYRQNCIDLCGITYSDPSSVQFRFLQYNRVGGTWYLDDICVSSGECSITPTELRFTELPVGCRNINTNFSVTVCATDGSGNTDNTYTDNITLTKFTGSGSLSGTTTLAASAGCATFNDLQLSQEDFYTLIASDGTLINDTSSLIEIKSACPQLDTLTVVTYNLLNFPNSLGGCDNYVANRQDTLKKIMKYINPDVLMVCELQDITGANMILNDVLNTDGVTKYAAANFVVNTSSGDNTHNNMFYYNTDKLNLYSQGEVQTDLRDVGEYIVYGNDPNIGTHNDTTFIDFYETHLKAGSNAADSLRRIEEADSIRKFIDLKPVGRNNIIGGDFNVYTDQEEAYQTLCYQGIYPFVDPVSREGDWNNNSAFSDIHSQSTRAGAPDYDCGSYGGVDDRFDFLLVSNNIMTGADRVTYVANSYSSLGNNGSSFNGNINDGSNTSSVPDSILNALFYMSDHLPVVMKVAVEYPSITLGSDSTYSDTHKFNDEELGLEAKVKLYPNPSNGNITIESHFDDESDGADYRLDIYNLIGELVFHYELNSGKESIALTGLSKGTYICSVSSETKPFLKERLIIY